MSADNFAGLEKGSPTEVEIEEEEEEEEFLSNEQIEEQDDALAALFRAARSSKMDAKSRKETVALLKLRSFDFLEYLLLYTSDANLFLPTLYTVIKMAVTSTGRVKQAQNQRLGSDKRDHVSLPRIASCLGQLRSRPLFANELLWQSICKSDEALLPTCFKAIFRVFRNAIPDGKLIKCLQTACEFLEIAELAGRLVIERLKAALPSSTSSSGSSSSCVYAKTALLGLANAVTGGLAGAKSQSLSDWVPTLARILIDSFFINSNASTWTQSKALTVAVFECLFNCFKSDKTVLELLTTEELTAVLTSDRASIPKTVRSYHSRLIQLIRSLRTSSQHLSAVLEGLDTQRKLEKEEAKQERRRKRKAKVAADQAKKKKAKLGIIVKQKAA
ncbi:unnamed protein product [Hydatigera taeniaeformis]|uniref:Uncharacterized protein n=1 Tax=Hydatigena taeniaeformis TaxID=6205 RepID=A0A0R3WNR2_HYDTA|nr:unnamed protein product [Hydatigera taeniaeformis]